MKNFRTFDAAVAFYKTAITLPLHNALKDQLHRAAQSIALNLAEGRGKPTKRDQVKFFYIAMGSLRECQAVLTLAEMQSTPAWNLLDILGASLYKLIEKAR